MMMTENGQAVRSGRSAEEQQRLAESIEGDTQRLYEAINVRRGASADLAAVRRWVSTSADVTRFPVGREESSLHCCILRGDVDALKVLLETPRDVDFTVRETFCNAYTPLHYVAGCGVSIHARKAMLAAVLERLATHPNDRVDWGQKSINFVYDFLGWAAQTSALSDLYPMVKHLPYYMNAAKPIMLSFRPKDEDWMKLSESDRMDLQRPDRKE